MPVMNPSSRTPDPIIFKNTGAFSALGSAQLFLTARGWSFGSASGKHPIGVMYGNVLIAKWKNLTDRERDQCHGIITGDLRNGPITISFRAHAPVEGLRAVSGETA